MLVYIHVYINVVYVQLDNLQGIKHQFNSKDLRTGLKHVTRVGSASL